MIVTDTNTIAYLYLPTKYAEEVENLLAKDSHWVAPLLWRSEFRSILNSYIRKELIGLDAALAIQSEAERQFIDNEFTVSWSQVLKLATESGCSTYDCEFVSLAKSLNSCLITADKALIKAFPDIAMTANQHLEALS